MIVVPLMLRRIVDLPEKARANLDLSALRIIFVGGSQLGAALASRALEALGPIVFNTHGTTVAFATVATPADLATQPGCVGGAVRGSIVKVLGEDASEMPVGTPGRIFVGSGLQFDGYTGGGTKPSIQGLIATGDVGHFDQAGRLFIDDRDDEMIVSGGENVYPGEVEEALAHHPAILEVAVIGVPDDEFGQRLRSDIVMRAGASLTAQDVKAYVKTRLARYKVPRDVLFVNLLPRNQSGKVLKRLLNADSLQKMSAHPAASRHSQMMCLCGVKAGGCWGSEHDAGVSARGDRVGPRHHLADRQIGL